MFSAVYRFKISPAAGVKVKFRLSLIFRVLESSRQGSRDSSKSVENVLGVGVGLDFEISGLPELHHYPVTTSHVSFCWRRLNSKVLEHVENFRLRRRLSTSYI